MHERKQSRGPVAWRWWVIGLGALGLGPGVACGGDSEGGDATPEAVTNACLGLGNRLSECGLLSGGSIDCSDTTVAGAIGMNDGKTDELVCLLGCFANADCASLQEQVCQDTGFGAGSISLVACYVDCAERFGFHCLAPGAAVTAVPSSLVCDGQNDCDDGSDEVDCELFACGDGTSVAPSAVCDGFFDCGNEQDEAMECPVFTCASGSTVPAAYRCDSEPDCSDGSDEAGCSEVAVISCGP